MYHKHKQANFIQIYIYIIHLYSNLNMNSKCAKADPPNSWSEKISYDRKYFTWSKIFHKIENLRSHWADSKKFSVNVNDSIANYEVHDSQLKIFIRKFFEKKPFFCKGRLHTKGIIQGFERVRNFFARGGCIRRGSYMFYRKAFC